MSYTLSDATELLERLEGRTKNLNLASAKSALNDLKPLLGESKDMGDSLSKIFKEGEQYDSRAISDATFATSEFRLWTEKVAKAVLEYKAKCCEKIQDIHKTYEAAESFLGKSLDARKKIIIGFFIVVIVLSVITAAFAIFGLLYYKDQWGELLAGVLGIIDFSVGICGLLIERIYDMREKKVSRAMNGIMRTPSAQLSKAEEYTKDIKIVIKDSIVGNGNRVYFPKTRTVKNAPINITENSSEANDATHKEVRQWEEEMKWWIKR